MTMDKYIVFKSEDIEKYTGNLTKAVLEKTAFLIAAGRARDGRLCNHRYAVINLDEPYAPEIIEIMKRNGHWG